MDRKLKNYQLVIREADHQVFVDLVCGLKTIETRAASAKYAGVAVGDTLTFVCGDDTVTKTVTGVARYASLDELYDQVPLARVLPSVRTRDEAKHVHFSFPGYREKLMAHGIMAFELST